MKNFELAPKQFEAYTILTEGDISELVFGGGARGGKTFLGSFWVITNCTHRFPNSAWLIFREELKALKRTTMRTFFKVLSILGYKKGVHYWFNAQDMVLTFANGSVVFFAELKRIPSDPEFDRIGSYDLTGAWGDEVQEISKDAVDVLQFRFTVTEGNGWSTIPRTLYTCNPSKGWVYSDFWKPLIKEGKKIEGRAFITSLYNDNPYIDQEKYKNNVLKTRNKVKIERLLHGNFEYDDSPNALFEYDALLDMSTNQVDASEDQYVTVDAARFGKDRLVVSHWRGWRVKFYVYRKKSTKEAVQILEKFEQKFKIPRSHFLIDEDGVGGGIVDHFEGAQGFLNGSKAIQPDDESRKLNYQNLKTQCYFLLADFVNLRKVRVDNEVQEIKEQLIEELEVVKQEEVDKDTTLKITKKEIIKDILGRSPDLADAMMMRMYFELNKFDLLTPHWV